ncbi:MAG: RidA family protein [Ilumatobacteraceae bacterium]
MNHEIAPPTIAPPAASYAHAVVSDGPQRLLHTSGIVPIAPGGTVPPSIDEQAVVVWSNIAAIVAEAGMSLDDVVSVTTYVVVDLLGALGTVMAARDRALGGRRVASTLVTVPALARPEWKVEIAVVAASEVRTGT